jgi:site-specific recombinase XerD
MYLVNGGTLHGLQRITGHKNIETLMIYVHLANQINAIAKEHAVASPLKQLTNREVIRESKRRRMVRF